MTITPTLFGKYMFGTHMFACDGRSSAWTKPTRSNGVWTVTSNQYPQ